MSRRRGPAIRRHRDRRASTVALVAAGAALCLAAGTGVGLATTNPTATPPAAGWQPGCVAGCQSVSPSTTPRPVPTRVRVPRIGVDSPLTALRLDAAGAIEPPTDFATAGWYGGGPIPGDPGPAVIAGHLDSQHGPAVFARLGELRPGDRVQVWRGEEVVPFRVTGTVRVPKDRFPTEAVYGPTPAAELRLVTCGGDFDRGTGHYRDNVVVFAIADTPVDVLPDSAAS